MNKLFILLILIVCISDGILSQTKRIRRDDLTVKVQVNVMSLSSNYFYYHYVLSNANNSNQSMSSLSIELHDEWLEHGGTLRNVVSPKEKDWGEYPSVGRKMWWNASYDTTGIDVLEQSPKSVILPGEHLSFQFECKGLPSIGSFWASGWAPWYFTSEEKDSLIKEGYPASDLQDIDENAFRGTTIVTRLVDTPFIHLVFLDTLLSYTNQSAEFGWIKQQSIADKYLGYFTSAKTNLQQNNVTSTRTTLQQVIRDVNVDSTNVLTSEAYALIRYNTEYLLAQLPTAPPPGCVVKLVNSTGAKLTGGTLQYYEGSWKDAVNNNDGTFFVNTTKTTLSLRMTYEYGTQTKSNVPISNDTIVFQTVNAQIQLQNSSGALIDTGTVQYYAGAWRNLGTTINGTAAKELLPANYSFRMTYAYASKDKQQDIGTNVTVIFQTVNAAVQLQNSQGTLIDQGTVQYYSGAWRTFGTTTSGVANKELLPNNYSFRMTYAYASKDKQQDIGTNPTVIFQTVNAAVQLQNSQSVLIDQGTVQYYSGAWRSLGITTNGTASKELLPNNYSFRMTYEYVSVDKSQDLSANNTVSFSTVLCTVRVSNLLGQVVNDAQASYYSGAWRQIGNTVNGVITKELLPVNLSFRVKYGTLQQDKQQNLSTNNLVEFAIQ